MSEKVCGYILYILASGEYVFTTKCTTINGVVKHDGQIAAVVKEYSNPVTQEQIEIDLSQYRSGVEKDGQEDTLRCLGQSFESEETLISFFGITRLASYRKQIAKGTARDEIVKDLVSKTWQSASCFPDDLDTSSLLNRCFEEGVSPGKTIRYIREGLDGDAAFEKAKKAIVRDHEGRIFSSVSSLCRRYGISRLAYDKSTEQGVSLEDTLLKTNKDQEYQATDHLGNKYRNVSQMCKAYDVEHSTFLHRQNRGWTLEESLTGVKAGRAEDHQGNTFPSIAAMCDAWNVQSTTYMGRINTGWTVEEALTGIRKTGVIVDHQGNRYGTFEAMCRAYGFQGQTVKKRMSAGWSLEDALTTPLHARYGNSLVAEKSKQKPSRFAIEDHLGQSYSSTKAMCEHWGINPNTFRDRIDRGLSVEDALTIKGRVNATTGRQYTDHLGNTFASLKAMCAEYHISLIVYKKRIEEGWSVEDALTTPYVKQTKKTVYDHLGNVFPSKVAMASHYGLTAHQLKDRLKSGWSLKNALEKPITGRQYPPAYDHEGKEFKNIKDMCAHYGVNYATFRSRNKAGYTLAEALGVEKRDNALKVRAVSRNRSSKKPTKVVDHTGKLFNSIDDMCSHYDIDKAVYSRRISDGWSVGDALTTGKGQHRKLDTSRYKDHLGNEYRTQKEMCEAHNLSPSTFRKRIKEGATLEEALCGAKGQQVQNEHTESEIEKTPTVFDHKGNAFDTIKDMCGEYGISYALFNKRKKKGWSLESILTTPVEDLTIIYQGKRYSNKKELALAFGKDPALFSSRLNRGWTIDEAMRDYKTSDAYIDHLGQEHPSMKAMCAQWGVEPSTYSARVKSGWTIEQALTSNPPKREKRPKQYHDHKGNAFPTLEALCEAYGITPHDYRTRIFNGYGVERALTTSEPSIAIADHTGRTFSSFKEMCEYWGITTSVYSSRVKRGWELERTLTEPVHVTEKRAAIDHTGRKFRSLREMCDYWGVSYGVFRRRTDVEGLSVAEALTRKSDMYKLGIKPNENGEIVYKGMVYKSNRELANKHGVSYATFTKRRNSGLSLEDALDPDYSPTQCFDHLGNRYRSIRQMCIHYGIGAKTYEGRIRGGWSMEDALTTPPGALCRDKNTGRFERRAD